MPGKMQQYVHLRQRASHQNVCLYLITIAAVRSKIITIYDQIGGKSDWTQAI